MCVHARGCVWLCVCAFVLARAPCVRIRVRVFGSSCAHVRVCVVWYSSVCACVYLCAVCVHVRTHVRRRAFDVVCIPPVLIAFQVEKLPVIACSNVLRYAVLCCPGRCARSRTFERLALVRELAVDDFGTRVRHEDALVD